MTTYHASRVRRWAPIALVVATLGLAACRPPSPAPPAPDPGTVALMGSSRLSGAQLAQWHNARSPGGYRATVDVGTLAQFYVEEGEAEGVRGDMAFFQAVLETGWFRFNGSVGWWQNNFAGIGATDTNPAPATFADARTGVRAQIQHLRAYGDASATTCAVPPLHNACVDPRFALVSPKGKAPTWNQMGNGNWATSTTYSRSILNLYSQALAFHGLAP